MSADALAPALGARVRVAPDGDAATVRYVGPVAGTAGSWVGVEFDAPGRGKHDGTHDGVRYFECSAPAGANCAAFVRAHKLRSGGVTLLEALLAKYSQARRRRCRECMCCCIAELRARRAAHGDASQASTSPPQAPDGDTAPAGADGAPPVRAARRERPVTVEVHVNEKATAKQRDLGQLTHAYLPDAGVSSVGPAGEVARHAGAITVLDLQVRRWQVGGAARERTARVTRAERVCGPRVGPREQGALLPDWPAVARVSDELPALQVLNLRHARGRADALLAQRVRLMRDARGGLARRVRSRVRGVLPAAPATGAPFDRLRTLVLNASGATWEQVGRLQPVLPALKELHLSDCCIATLEGGGTRDSAAFRFAASPYLRLPVCARATRRELAVAADPEPHGERAGRLGARAEPGACTRARGERWRARDAYLLTCLMLARCHVTQASLPSLEQLVLNGNALAAVRPPRGERGFAALGTLLLADNRIVDWRAPNTSRTGSSEDRQS